jgi:Flp pilus assembly protein TadG
MTTLNKPANEKAQAAANTNYNEILGLGFKIEIRSQSNGKSRAYLTDNKNERIMENGVPISIDFYDNKGQSVNPVLAMI